MSQYLSKALTRAVNPVRRIVLALSRRADAGPRVIANSIPKSGTHLLMRCLERLPGMTPYHEGVYFLRRDKPGYALRLRTLLAMGGGCFVMTHLPYRDDLSEAFDGKGFKMILMIRDPRDIVVSHFHFALKKKLHPRHAYYQSLKDDDARLTASIEGEPSQHLLSIGQLLEKYTEWVNRGALLVRFEDLIGEGGGGSKLRQIDAVRQIAEYLDMTIDDQTVMQIADSVFSKKSHTFRKGAIGEWRNHFKPHHVKAFNRQVGESLSKLGYSEAGG